MVGVSARPVTGRELVRLLAAHPQAKVEFEPAAAATASSPTRPGWTGTPTPTCSPCPTASPRPMPRGCGDSAPPGYRDRSLRATCACPTPTRTARGTGTSTRASAAGLRPRTACRALPRAPPRRAPRLEPRLLRDLGAAAAGAARPRAAGRPAGRGGRREERATGAGRTLREDLLFCEVDGDFSAYSPGRTHRHVGEMEAVLQERTGRAVPLTFCPHLLPVKRGILSAAPRADPSGRRRSCAATLPRSTRTSRSCGRGQAARLSDVDRTNLCLLSVHAASARPRGRVLGARQPREGRGGTGHQNLNLAAGPAGDGRTAMSVRVYKVGGPALEDPPRCWRPGGGGETRQEDGCCWCTAAAVASSAC